MGIMPTQQDFHVSLAFYHVQIVILLTLIALVVQLLLIWYQQIFVDAKKLLKFSII